MAGVCGKYIFWFCCLFCCGYCVSLFVCSIVVSSSLCGLGFPSLNIAMLWAFHTKNIQFSENCHAAVSGSKLWRNSQFTC